MPLFSGFTVIETGVELLAPLVPSPLYWPQMLYVPPGSVLVLPENDPLLNVYTPWPCCDSSVLLVISATAPVAVPLAGFTVPLTVIAVPCVKLVSDGVSVVVVLVNVTLFQSLTRTFASTVPSPLASS